jgi:hypothetical protein
VVEAVNDVVMAEVITSEIDLILTLFSEALL